MKPPPAALGFYSPPLSLVYTSLPSPLSVGEMKAKNSGKQGAIS